MERVLQARIIFCAVEMLRASINMEMHAETLQGPPAYTLPYSKMAGRNFSWISQMLSRL